jgi:glucan phosphoethanolaminetransferase (alkaline phosphatase superfamily)
VITSRAGAGSQHRRDLELRIQVPAIPLRWVWLADLALWLGAAAIFMLVYTSEPQVSTASAAAHAAVVVLGWLLLTVVRMVVAMIVPHPAAARAVSAFIVSASAMIVAAYYALVISGLHLWGRVVSWDLARTYGGHARALGEVLGASLYVVVFAAITVFAVVLVVVWRTLERFDWVATFARTTSSRRYVLAVVAVAAASAAGLMLFRTGLAIDSDEPLSLTFYPERAAMQLQGHGIDRLRAGELDALEDAARAAYRVDVPTPRRNLILIVVDALRADHMGIYGYARDTTPNLSRLARAGAIRIVPKVRASCTSSACGMLSLLASKFVHQFSVRPITLHEVLKRHGYRVHLVLGVNHTDFYGLREMYGPIDSYYDTAHEDVEHMDDDSHVLRHAAALPQWDGNPVMIQFHLMSAHPLGVRDARYAKYGPAANYVIMGARTPRTAANYYDNGVLQVDAVIDELMSTLRAKGYLRDTLIAITADHGEALGEGGRYAHARGLEEELLGIPFVLIAEGYAPPALARDATRIASQVDVAPTILRELGITAPRTWAGIPLQEHAAHDFLYMQELDAFGLIDQRDPRQVWKYWVEGRNGRERAMNLSVHAEATDALHAVSPERLREWRLRYLRLVPSATLVTRAP